MTDPQAVRRALLGLAALAVLSLILPACTSVDPASAQGRRKSDRKWYQGEMDNSDRSFFIDSFFNGR